MMRTILTGTIRGGIIVVAICICMSSPALAEAQKAEPKAVAPAATTVSPTPAELPATRAVKSAPANGSEHPFFKRMDKVAIGRKAVAMPAQARSAFAEATAPRKRAAKARIGGETIDVTLQATPEVSEAMFTYLASNLGGVRVDLAKRQDLAPMLTGPSKLQKGAAEVRLPSLPGVMFTWPDGWEFVRPNVLRLKGEYRNAAPREAPLSAPRSTAGVGVVVQAITGSWSQVSGQILCQAPDDSAPSPVPFVSVIINGMTQPTDASGLFVFNGSFTAVNTVSVRYDGSVAPAPGIASGPRIYVMDDFHNPRGEDITSVGGTTTPVGGPTTPDVLQLALPVLVSLDCELFQHGTKILQEYHNQTFTNPPAGDFRIKRWEGIDSIPGTITNTPYAFYDYVVIAKDFRRWDDTRGKRFATLTHEFGHTIRHSADGDMSHWNWDNVRWFYGRSHGGNEIFNEQYAFNEGWGNFWKCSRTGVTDLTKCLGINSDTPPVSALDWNEKRIGERLVAMSSSASVGRPAMQRLLRDNPGSIHTFRDFENRFCARFITNTRCSGGAPTRTKQECPPHFIDDGATCRFDNILAKNSYGRGAGTVPVGCGSSQNNAGLCYQPCRAGFEGVGPVCWKRCPTGMHDDGAFCRRDVSIIGSDNSRCPWYDVCGVAVSRGCSRCPSGYQNDGCTCRRDAWIFAKESYGRGAGTIPTQCPAGKQYDAGLCYPPCTGTYTGVGPVCWDRCPEGYADHGATCYRDPNVIVKY